MLSLRRRDGKSTHPSRSGSWTGLSPFVKKLPDFPGNALTPGQRPALKPVVEAAMDRMPLQPSTQRPVTPGTEKLMDLWTLLLRVRADGRESLSVEQAQCLERAAQYLARFLNLTDSRA